MTVCTIDVHARDVVAKLIQQKVDNSQAFTWLSQLRHRLEDVCSVYIGIDVLPMMIEEYEGVYTYIHMYVDCILLVYV